MLTCVSPKQWEGRPPAVASPPVNPYDLLQNVNGAWAVQPSSGVPSTNDVWSWNGTIWTPRAVGAGAIQPFVPDANTVGLWRLDGSLSNLVDPSNPLIVDVGTEVYADIVPGKRAFYFSGGTRLKVNAFVSALARTGDVTCAMMIQLDADPTSSTIFCGHGASGETQAANILYSMQCLNSTPPRSMNFLSEHDNGVNDSFTTSAPASLPPIHNIGLLGFSRISDIIQFYYCGKPLGSASSALNTPNGGGNGRFYVGASDGTTVCTRMLCWGVMVEDIGWTDSEWLACYNQTLGPAFGTLT